MSRLPFYFSLAAVLVAGAHAEESAPAKLPAFELKNRSSFTLDASTRTPFWPVGWIRPIKGAPVAAVQTPKIQAAKFQIKDHGGSFKVTSLLLGNPPLATINGRAYGEGEFLPVEAGGQPIRVVVKVIRDGGVILEHDAQQLYVPMKREILDGSKPVAPTTLRQPDNKIVIPDAR